MNEITIFQHKFTAESIVSELVPISIYFNIHGFFTVVVLINKTGDIHDIWDKFQKNICKI